MSGGLETLSRHRAFEGEVHFVRHDSRVTGTPMRFSVFVPPAAATGKVPVLTYLAGLTCTEETFMIKAGAQRVAAELGLMLVAPDTSPRGDDVPDDPDGGWDFGLGAGFYLDATQAPWRRHYRMASYVTDELQELVFAHYPGDRSRQGLLGHSMGGHGALVLGTQASRDLDHPVGVRACRSADAMPVGPEGVWPLPRERRDGLGRVGCEPTGREDGLVL